MYLLNKTEFTISCNWPAGRNPLDDDWYAYVYVYLGYLDWPLASSWYLDNIIIE